MGVWVDIFGRVQERDLQRQIDKMADDLDTAGQRAGSRLGDGVATGLMRSSPKVQKAFNVVETSSERATLALQRYRKALQDNDSDSQTLTSLTIALGKARRDEADAHRAAAATMRTVTEETRNASGALEELKRTLVSPTRALVSIAGPELIAALIQTAQVAVTASQALLLLPAAATAAGAGILTLKLATDGFGQAMKDIHDIKKFNDDIAQLSPNAQSAAMAIKTMLPQLDGLKNATQDAFFAGFDQKIQQLSGTFLPSIQGLTTGIASAMNQSISGVADMLMSPSGKSDVAAIATNIGEAFRAAAPAVQSFSQAFLEITKVGSDFLPSLGEGIAGAAREFASFIHDAAESGKLKDWIQQGINAAEALGGVITDIGKRIYEVFGGASQSEIDAWRTNMTDSLDIIQGILTTLTTTLEVLNAKIPGIGKGFLEWVNPLLIIRDIVNGIRWFLDPTYKADNSPLNAATQKLNDARAKKGLPPVDDQGNVTGPTTNYSPSPDATDPNRNFGGLLAALTRLPGEGAVAGRGLSTFLGRNENSSGWGPSGGLFSDPTKNLPKDKASKYSAPADQWSLGSVPIGAFPGVPGPAIPPLAGMPGGPPLRQLGPVNQLEAFTAQSAVLTAQHKVEEDRQAYLKLAHDTTATETELLKAKNNVAESERALIADQMKLNKTLQGDYKGLASGLGEIGAALDKDLGISKGLPGIADNLVRFLASLAAAPLMGKLAADVANDPHKGGYGLMGILGAQGAFGPQFTGLDQGATTGQYTTPNYGTGGIPGAAQGAYQNATGIPATVNAAATGGPPGAYPGDAALLANVKPGSYVSQPGVGDLTKGIGDCTSSIEDLVNLLDGKSTAGRTMATGNEADFLTQHGFLPTNQPVPGSFQVGFNAGHSQATLPGGTNFNWGSTEAAQAGGVNGSGAWDPAFTQHYYRPTSSSGAPTAAPPAGGNAPAGASPSPMANPSNPALYNPATGTFGFGSGGWGYAGDKSVNIGNRSAEFGRLKGGNIVTGGGNVNPDIKIDTSNANTTYPGYSVGAHGVPYGGMQGRYTASRVFNGQAFVGGAPPLSPNTAPGLPDLSGTAWANNRAGVSLGPAQVGGPLLDQPNIGPGPLQPGGVSTPAPGSIGPFGVPPSVAAAAPMAGSGLAGGAGAVGPTKIGGLAPSGSISPGGGIGITPGGSLDTAISLAASAFPGLGQAAQTGMKLANRAIQYGGQLAGIGIQGLMETFLPTGGSELANNGWGPRLVGALAGAAPALPNIAGGKGGAPAPPPLTPDQVASGQGTGPPPGPSNVGITVNNNNASPDQNGRIIAHHASQAHTLPGAPNKPGQ